MGRRAIAARSRPRAIPLQRLPVLELDERRHGALANSSRISLRARSWIPSRAVRHRRARRRHKSEIVERHSAATSSSVPVSAFRHIDPAMKEWEVPQAAAMSGQVGQAQALDRSRADGRELARCAEFAAGDQFSIADIDRACRDRFHEEAGAHLDPEEPDQRHPLARRAEEPAERLRLTVPDRAELEELEELTRRARALPVLRRRLRLAARFRTSRARRCSPSSEAGILIASQRLDEGVISPDALPRGVGRPPALLAGGSLAATSSTTGHTSPSCRWTAVLPGPADAGPNCRRARMRAGVGRAPSMAAMPQIDSC